MNAKHWTKEEIERQIDGKRYVSITLEADDTAPDFADATIVIRGPGDLSYVRQRNGMHTALLSGRAVRTRDDARGRAEVWLVARDRDGTVCVLGTTRDEELARAVHDKTWSERRPSVGAERWAERKPEFQSMREPTNEDKELFETFRCEDAEGGVVRSYAHLWAGHTAVAWAVEKLWTDASARIRFVIADHHKTGNKSYHFFELYREGDQLRTKSGDGDYMIASFYAGLTFAAAELASALASRAKRYDAIIFRQP